MDYTVEELSEMGCRIGSVEYASLAADVLRLEFSGTLRGYVPLPFAEGDAVRVLQDGVCIFRGWVTGVDLSQDSFVWVAGVEVKNVVALLDVLPVEVSSYDTEQRLERAAGLVEQALSAARQCTLLADEGFEVSVDASVMAVFSSGTESVWSNILAALRWVPNAASWYDHEAGVLHLLGGTAAAGKRAAGRVVFGENMLSGTLVVGMSTLVVDEGWTEVPARRAAALLRGSAEVAAVAADDFTLELTARAPGVEGNELALEFTAGAEGDVAVVEGFAGGTANEGTVLATLESLQGGELPGEVVSVASSRTAWEVPPVVALRGRYEFTLPEGASVYQPGAFVYHVPKKDVGVGGGGMGDGELGTEEQAAVQRAGGEWMVVKGYMVPPGWQRSDGEAVYMREAVGNGTACHEFWGRYLSELRRTDVSCLSYGTAVFEPMPVEEAYPEDPEDNETQTLAGVTKWCPPLLESKNGPANYEEFVPQKGASGLYVCYEGQFPASSEARGNVSGLKFCRGTLRQYVWLRSKYTGLMTGLEAQKFFEGSMRVETAAGTELVSYTQLTLEGVFINRRRTRYQSGTNGQPEETADDGTQDEESEDSGSGGLPAPSTELSKRDYVQALTDYYYSSRIGGSHGSLQLAGVGVYRHGAGLGVLKGARWNPASGELVLTTGAGGPVGVDAILQRQQVGKMQALADLQSSLAAASVPTVEDEEEDEEEDDEELLPGDEEEKEEYPMVGGGASASHQVNAKAARLEPFAVYMEDDGRMMINGGPLPCATGLIEAEAVDISDLWVAGREFYMKARWNRSSKQWEAVVLYRDPKTSES